MHMNPGQFQLIGVWLAYVTFVIYGSLVPLDFHPLSFEHAWATFRNTPMLVLGVESRADWIANGVLFVPVGFLTAHVFLPRFTEKQVVPIVVVSGLCSLALAVAIEFSQLYFPPRTVSLNDPLAEVIGSALGLVLAVRYTRWVSVLHNALFSNSRQLMVHLAEAYLVGYIAFSLFPYDLLLSYGELVDKLNGPNWGWLWAAHDQGVIVAIIKLGAEGLLAVPFGLYLGYRTRHRSSISYAWAILLGACLGLALELAQLFLASGVTQGLSLVSRVAGTVLGLMLWRFQGNFSVDRTRLMIRRHLPILGAGYGLLLLVANGWFRYSWIDLDEGIARLSELHFLPFYYHYYTTEALALISLSSVCLMYLPIGVVAWARGASAVSALTTALFASATIETGKLFLEGTHPDPSNLLIAGFAAWGGVHLLQLIVSSIHGTHNSGHRHESELERYSVDTGEKKGGRSLVVILATLVIAFVVLEVATFPVFSVGLSALFIVVAAMLWRRPVLLAGLMPAASPLLDLAPWSGRFYFDEFDLMLMLGFAIVYLRTPSGPTTLWKSDRLFNLGSMLVAFVFSIAAIRGLLPLHAIDGNSFTNYYSPFNGLRLVKGVLWALLFWWLVRRLAKNEQPVTTLFAKGMALGAAGTALVVFWERLVFPGLLNFEDIYRVTGPFSQMHVGGADLEVYLTIATPFVVKLLLDARTGILRALYGCLLLGITYSVLVTYSRIGYLGWGIAFMSALGFYFWCERKDINAHTGRKLIPVVALVLVVLGVGSPIFFGQFAQQRLALVASDFDVRSQHWADALNMRDPDWDTSLLGMGLGTYPATHYLRSREPKAGAYSMLEQDGKPYVRQGAGSPLYIEQLVSVASGEAYQVTIRARSKAGQGQVNLSFCEKWLLTSAVCNSQFINLSDGKDWGTYTTSFMLDAKSTAGGLLSRPIKFSFYNASSSAMVDIDEIVLLNRAGQNLLRNSDFSNGLDHWFFAIDNDLPWHAWSLPVQVLFEQGWIGLMVFGSFVLGAFWRTGKSAISGWPFSGAIFAAVLGVSIIGTMDSVIDSPRVLLIWFVLLLFPWTEEKVRSEAVR